MSEQCAGCQHLLVDDLAPGQHCYMFAQAPQDCRKHTGRGAKPLLRSISQLEQAMPLLLQAEEMGELDAILERLRLQQEGKDFRALEISHAAEALYDRLYEILGKT